MKISDNINQYHEKGFETTYKDTVKRQGNTYDVYKAEKKHKMDGWRVIHGAAAVFGIIFTLGLGVASKKIRNWLEGREVLKIYIPEQAAASASGRASSVGARHLEAAASNLEIDDAVIRFEDEAVNEAPEAVEVRLPTARELQSLLWNRSIKYQQQREEVNRLAERLEGEREYPDLNVYAKAKKSIPQIPVDNERMQQIERTMQGEKKGERLVRVLESLIVRKDLDIDSSLIEKIQKKEEISFLEIIEGSPDNWKQLKCVIVALFNRMENGEELSDNALHFLNQFIEQIDGLIQEVDDDQIREDCRGIRAYLELPVLMKEAIQEIADSPKLNRKIQGDEVKEIFMKRIREIDFEFSDYYEQLAQNISNAINVDFRIGFLGMVKPGKVYDTLYQNRRTYFIPEDFLPKFKEIFNECLEEVKEKYPKVRDISPDRSFWDEGREKTPQRVSWVLQRIKQDIYTSENYYRRQYGE